VLDGLPACIGRRRGIEIAQKLLHEIDAHLAPHAPPAHDRRAGPRSQQIERWASNQVYIALGTFMTAAALLEVDTCPIEGFSPLDYDRILGLESSPYRSCVVCAAGYRDASDKYAALAKVRYAPTELIEHL